MKFIIFFLIIISLIYIVSGRYSVAQNNMQERGLIALLDEPLWLCSLVYEQWIKIKDATHDFIDGKTLGPQHDE